MASLTSEPQSHGHPWSSGEKHQHKRFFLPTYWPQSAWRSFPWKPSSKAGGNSVLYNQEQDLQPGLNKTFQSQCAPLENSITGRWWNFVFVVISTKSVTSVLLLAMWPLAPGGIRGNCNVFLWEHTFCPLCMDYVLWLGSPEEHFSRNESGGAEAELGHL